MVFYPFFYSLLLFFFFFHLGSQEHQLLEDLLIVDCINQQMNERLPITYNIWSQGGYFVMPSARMGQVGEISVGGAYVPPYHTYNLRCQFTDRLEITGNYRVFRGVKDPVLGDTGFGDFSDKGANIKFSLFSPEDSDYKLPGVAIGMDDFMGTRAFKSYYIVATQVFLKQNFEISLGYGGHRIRGFFGGMNWFPFRKSQVDFLKGLSFGLEYDATPYSDCTIERHPHGRVKKTPWNLGLHYRIYNGIDLSLASLRGQEVTFSLSVTYNFGNSKGIVPKLEERMPYQAPANFEPIGPFRPAEIFVQDLVFAFQLHGFELFNAVLETDSCNRRILRLSINNQRYRMENDMREQMTAIIAHLTPEDIDEVICVLLATEVPVQEYRYHTEFLDLYREQKMGRYELDVLTPRRDVVFSCQNLCERQVLYEKKRPRWCLEWEPKTHTLFGSARGKFKYALGLSMNFLGYFPDDTFYTVKLGYFFLSNLYDISDMDCINPSQLINVRTDIINYYKQKSITIDEAYVQKIVNLGRGLYSKMAVGYFEPEYAGTAAEFLYYPATVNWAIGIEGAILKKRRVDGFLFTNKVRKLCGTTPTYVHFLGKQYFLNLHYDFKSLCWQTKISVGKFLADDYGVRTEVTRYFPSGLRVTFWYTYTNGHDVVNRETYYDKGVAISMPLDLFYMCSSQARWGYGMSAWLRDVGVKGYTGMDLYYLINQQRQ